MSFYKHSDRLEGGVWGQERLAPAPELVPEALGHFLRATERPSWGPQPAPLVLSDCLSFTLTRFFSPGSFSLHVRFSIFRVRHRSQGGFPEPPPLSPLNLEARRWRQHRAVPSALPFLPRCRQGAALWADLGAFRAPGQPGPPPCLSPPRAPRPVLWWHGPRSSPRRHTPPSPRLLPLR